MIWRRGLVKTTEEEDQNGEEDNLVLVCERQGEGENSPIGNVLLVPEGEIPEGFSQEAIFYFIEKINLDAALATFFCCCFHRDNDSGLGVILAVQEAQTADEAGYARGKG
jgi:hypothetical protein